MIGWTVPLFGIHVLGGTVHPLRSPPQVVKCSKAQGGRAEPPAANQLSLELQKDFNDIRVRILEGRAM